MSTSGPPGQPRGASHPGTVCMDPIPPSPSTQRPWLRPGGRDGAETMAWLVVSGGHKRAFTSPQDRAVPPGAKGSRPSAQLGKMLLWPHPQRAAGRGFPQPPAWVPVPQPSRQPGPDLPSEEGCLPRPTASQPRKTLGFWEGPQVPSSTGWGWGRTHTQGWQSSGPIPAGPPYECPVAAV